MLGRFASSFAADIPQLQTLTLHITWTNPDAKQGNHRF